MNSKEAHSAGVKFLQEKQPENAFFAFLKAYEINDAHNKYGHLYRMATSLATLQHFSFAKLLFSQCYYKINNVNLWIEFLKIMYNKLTTEEIKVFSHMYYESNFDTLHIYNYVNVLKNIICLKQQDNINCDEDIKLLSYKYNKKNEKKLIIAFTSRGSMQFQHTNLLKDCKSDVLYIRDIQDAWYNKGLKFITTDIDSTVLFLKNFIKDYDKVLTLGGSAGGYAALLFGSLLNADTILAFSPQTIIPREKPFPDEDLLLGVDKKYFDLRPIINSECKINIFYSSGYKSDTNAALRLKDFPNIRLHPYDFGNEHNIISPLVHNGVYFKFINEFDK